MVVCVAAVEKDEDKDSKEDEPPVSNDSGNQAGPKREPSSAAHIMTQPGILAGRFTHIQGHTTRFLLSSLSLLW